jgi:ferredoxin-NADP reductase
LNPLRPIDKFLNGITMYRLLVYGLGIIAGIGIAFSALGTLSYSVSGMLVSLVTLAAVCYIANKLMARVWEVGTNNESWLITALILFCILPAATTKSRFLAIALAGLVAMISKYLITYHGKHLFNPAAFGAAFITLVSHTFATWWIGNSTMLVFLVVFGLLVVRKLRRFPLVLAFLITSLVLMAILSIGQTIGIHDTLVTAIESSPLIFLGSIMLTEPATMPAGRTKQIIFGALVGALFATHIHITPEHYVTPEGALLIGNVYAFLVSPKYKLRLKFKQRTQLSEHVYDYSFVSNRTPKFEPGQYLEWTLPHRRQDGRGNRRTFTIASSPTEPEVHLGVKFYEPSSSFKKALVALKPGDTVLAGQLNGDFSLPRNKSHKLAFVAGGIGITPFRSMVKYLVDKNEKCDIVLYYIVSDPAELSYLDLFNEAPGVKVVKVLSAKVTPAGWDGQVGRITPEMLTKFTPDFRERHFYLSGPNSMVEAYNGLLRKAGVSGRKITTDYFSGY